MTLFHVLNDQHFIKACFSLYYICAQSNQIIISIWNQPAAQLTQTLSTNKFDKKELKQMKEHFLIIVLATITYKKKTKT